MFKRESNDNLTNENKYTLFLLGKGQSLLHTMLPYIHDVEVWLKKIIWVTGVLRRTAVIQQSFSGLQSPR